MAGELAPTIQRLIEESNRCWLEGRPSEVRRFLHPDVVFAGPAFRRLARGAEACAKSYEDFVANATVHAFEAGDYAVDVAGEAAVATYRWSVDYQIGVKRYRETGREVLVFVREAGRWLIAWRAQAPEPDAAAG